MSRGMFVCVVFKKWVSELGALCRKKREDVFFFCVCLIPISGYLLFFILFLVSFCECVHSFFRFLLYVLLRKCDHTLLLLPGGSTKYCTEHYRVRERECVCSPKQSGKRTRNKNGKIFYGNEARQQLVVLDSESAERGVD